MASYRILCIDGGGIRGLYASILIQRLAAAVPDLVERCDLLSGTSTGGIIALALAKGVPIEALIELYATRGRDVFGEAAVRHSRGASGMVVSSDNRALHALLDRVLGKTTLGGLRKRVLIPAFHLDNHGERDTPRMWKPKFFHNFPGPGSDAAERAVDVALRTSAAPTYFPAYQGYIDGGVVANNPSMAAIAQALDPATGRQALAAIVLLSIGTGLNPMYIEAQTLDWGLEQWAKPLVTLMMDGMMTVVDYQCTRLLGSRFHRLAPILPSAVGLDDAERADDLIAYARAVDLGPSIAWLQQSY
ncbi:MAG: patatin-like phospholipase family protein [Gemmataceae bacterium]|nr:patatin-like phospholipase family protein [Gemmataceae bacterium]